MADLLCKIPTFYPIPQNRFVVLFPEEIAVDGYVVSKVEFINDKTFTFKMYTTENSKEVVKLFKNKEIGTLPIIFIDRTGAKTMRMNLCGVSIKSIYPVKLDYTSVENVEFIVTAEYSEIGYE